MPGGRPRGPRAIRRPASAWWSTPSRPGRAPPPARRRAREVAGGLPAHAGGRAGALAPRSPTSGRCRRSSRRGRGGGEAALAPPARRWPPRRPSRARRREPDGVPATRRRKTEVTRRARRSRSRSRRRGRRGRRTRSRPRPAAMRSSCARRRRRRAPAPLRAPGVHRYEAAVFALGRRAGAGHPGALPAGRRDRGRGRRRCRCRCGSCPCCPRTRSEQKLADIRGPVAVAIGRAFWIALAGGAAAARRRSSFWLCAAAASARPAAPPPSCRTSPPTRRRSEPSTRSWPRACLARGEYRAFYIALAAIAKRYLERRLRAPVARDDDAPRCSRFLREHAQRPRPRRRRCATSRRPPTRSSSRGARASTTEAERHLAAVRGARSGTLEAAAAPGRPGRRSERRSPDGLGRLPLPGPALALGRCSLGAARAARGARCASGDGSGRSSFPGPSRARGHARRAGGCACATCPLVARPRLGLVAGAVALARPAARHACEEDVTTQGVDIVVALDVSGSMAAEDFQPRNRLGRGQGGGGRVREAPAPPTASASWSSPGKSLTKSPPTTDTAVLLRQLDDVRLDMLPDGTAIGSGLATALTRLRRSKAKSQVVVLVTDGANNAGEIDPATAADLAKAMEVRVYTDPASGRGGAGADAGAGARPLHRPDGDADGDDRGADRRGPARSASPTARAASSSAPPTRRRCATSSTASTGSRSRRSSSTAYPPLPRALPAGPRWPRPLPRRGGRCSWAAGLRVAPA